MREIPFFIPPIYEQAAIVRYLDYVDRRVRRYVAAKERLIGLLEEEKQASSTAPSPAASTPTSPSNPPASNGSATCQRIGRSSD